MNYLYFNVFSPQTFLFRSWASTRVMTAEQRAALLDLVARRDLREKLSYRECGKIAKDLNLTLEQVICDSYIIQLWITGDFVV